MIKIEDIEDEEIPAVLAQLASRLHALTLARAKPADGDHLLSIDEAALRLNVSRSWIYQRSRSLPFIVRFGRKLSADERGLEEYIAARKGRI